MANKTKIEWSEYSWNPFGGCSLVSPGCTNCYAMKQAGRIVNMTAAAGKPSHYAGTTRRVKESTVWTGKINRAPDHIFYQPLAWTRPRTIFVNSMSDLFHEGISDEQIDEVFAIMALCPQHTFQVLTKRPERMLQYMTEKWQPHKANKFDIGGGTVLDVPAADKGDTREDRVREAAEPIILRAHEEGTEDRFYNADESLKWPAWPLPNVWLGVSVEDQARAEERILPLLKTPAAVRFLSCEPLLGALDLTVIDVSGDSYIDALNKRSWKEEFEDGWKNTEATEGEDVASFLDWFDLPGDAVPAGNMHPVLDWVIVGGESGHGARPMHPDWVRKIRDACLAAGTAFFFKQWGEYVVPEDGAPACRVCGCTQNNACEGRCAWHEPGLCTSCVGKEPQGDERAVKFLRVGKKEAGRTLDGAVWSELPGMKTLTTESIP